MELTGVFIFTAVGALAIAGCAAPSIHAGPASVTAAQASNPLTTDPRSATANTGPIGSTLRVWNGQSVAEFTVSNARIVDGKTRVDVTVVAEQGDANTVGTFSGMDNAGTKVDQVDPSLDVETGQITGLDWSGTMVPGEHRGGYVDIPETGIAMIYLSEGILDPFAASWKVS